jgi:16S rRNA (cytidine1402-2'-O)-methyltransferase
MGDMSPRAVAALLNASLAASEDTRRTARLLNWLGISLPQLSYREQSHAEAWPRVREVLARGLSVALMTDAGSPAVSDPGALLCAAAREEGFGVWPLPGPSAVTAALSAAGFVAGSYTFCGFPPPRPSARRAWLAGFRRLSHPLVLFEAPHRLAESLADLLEILGPRRALVAREMSKFHEEFLFGDLGELLAEVTASPRLGEMTLVIEGAARARGAAVARTEEFFGDLADGNRTLPEGTPAAGDTDAEPVAGRATETAEGDAGGTFTDGGAAGDGSDPDGGSAPGGPLCSPRAVAALKTLWEAAQADSRKLSESAGELSGLTGIPKKVLYALLSHFRSPED